MLAKFSSVCYLFSWSVRSVWRSYFQSSNEGTMNVKIILDWPERPVLKPFHSFCVLISSLVKIRQKHNFDYAPNVIKSEYILLQVII